MDDDRTEKIDLEFSQIIRDEPDDIIKFKKVVGFLTLREENSPPTDFPLYDGGNCIGRAKDNQVFIDNKALSNSHAIIRMKGNTSSVIQDLRSLNGTIKGQVLLKPYVEYPLENNDVLWFANVKTTFKFSNPPLKDISNIKKATDGLKTASFFEKSNIFDDTEDSVRINEEQLAIPGTSKSSVVHEVFKKLHNLHDTMDSVSKVPPGEHVLKKKDKNMISSDSEEDELPVNSASKEIQENRAKEPSVKPKEKLVRQNRHPVEAPGKDQLPYTQDAKSDFIDINKNVPKKDFAAEEPVPQTIATKRNRRPRKAPSRLDKLGFNIMFNDLTCPISEKIIKSLGGNVTEDINSFSILIADKFRRTIELVCAFAMGVPVINGEWIKNAKKEKTLKNYEKFMLKDRDAESKYSFKIEETLKRASETPLFTGWSIHVTKNVVPAPRQMKDIIKCAGGNFLAKMPKKSAEKTIIVSCEEDLNLCNDAKKNGIPIVDYEFILTGILAYQIDIEKHKL